MKTIEELLKEYSGDPHDGHAASDWWSLLGFEA